MISDNTRLPMTSDDESGLLYIEPQSLASLEPLIDTYTRRMCAAYRKSRVGDGAWGGIHMCYCGACSDNVDHYLPNGVWTNSLCTHYLAHHREAVPVEQLERIARFAWGEAEPTEDELQGPKRRIAGTPKLVEELVGRQRLDAWIALGLDFAALCRDLHSGGHLRWHAWWELMNNILRGLPVEGFEIIRRRALESHGSIEAWAADAFCLPVNQALWREPLIEMAQWATSSGSESRHHLHGLLRVWYDYDC